MKVLSKYNILIFIFFLSCTLKKDNYYDLNNNAATTPVLTTNTASAITYTSTVSGGNIKDDGGSNITARGVCWGTSTEPTTVLSTKTNDGTGKGIFTSTINGLNPNTQYYLRAYCINSIGTTYGNTINFTTPGLSIANITTVPPNSITNSSAVCGGSITNNGGSNITAKGVCWSTSSAPTIALSTKTNDGLGTDSFTSNITGLNPFTKYYVRAYATNNTGTAYGNEVYFTTNISLPTVTTSTATSITSFSAISGGNIAADGGSSISAKGVCWGTSSAPTIALSTKTNDGTGLGSYLSNISGLNPNIKYYLRAYATNSVGTAYGNEINFTTYATTPVISTVALTTVTNVSAISGGNITSDGGLNITAKGVCWDISPSPAITLSTKTNDGTGAAGFVSNIIGLNANTTYYARAYATNSLGTTYGNEINFKTADSFVVGQSYGGGIIGYLLQPSDLGYSSTTQHGLIIATTDQSTGIQWQNGTSTTTGATDLAIGTGLINTNAIIAAQGAGSYAAMICHNIAYLGFNDWYLPSRLELYALYLNRAKIGNFANNIYWSSSEATLTTSYYVNFADGSQGFNYKDFTFNVRAIRSF